MDAVNLSLWAGGLWASGSGPLLVTALVGHRNGDRATTHTATFGAAGYALAAVGLLVVGTLGAPAAVHYFSAPVAVVAALFAADFARRQLRDLEPWNTRDLLAGAAVCAVASAVGYASLVRLAVSLGG